MTAADVVVHAQGSTIEIRLSGEIDLSNSDAVREKIFASISNHLVAVALDLSEVSYIDSAGLRVLFALTERLRLLQTKCTMIAPPGSPTRRVLEMTGMNSVAELKP